MDKTIAALFALGILALLVIAFFAVFRGKGKVRLKSKLFGELSAGGENPPPSSSVASGVATGRIKSGGAVTTHSGSSGGVKTGDIEAAGDVTTTHTPGLPLPKT